MQTKLVLAAISTILVTTTAFAQPGVVAPVGASGAAMQRTMGSPKGNSGQLAKLSAEWWQWAYSIPSSVNPMEDRDGTQCMVGQRGDLWFLAGTFTGGSANRTCAVPEGVELFFPVANSSFIAIDCDGSPTGESIEDARAGAAEPLDGTEIVAVDLDGQPITKVERVRSRVFAVTLPEENVFDQFCGDTPAGVFSPAVDDGYYVKLTALPAGRHVLRFETTGEISQNVTYTLDVTPVRLK